MSGAATAGGPSAAQLQRHLRHANRIAQRALAAGRHPFGALLVAADHETVLLEQGNVDAVEHAEAVLARAAARRWPSCCGPARCTRRSSRAACVPVRSTGRTSGGWSTA
jgi:tRNA(Arg) A34 adenosine deaminase TadA